MNDTTSQTPNLLTRIATPQDIPLILNFIHGIAAFENLSHQVTATEVRLKESLFGEKPSAEVSLVFVNHEPAGYAVYFHNFSTFEGKKGLYLEDLFIKTEFRGRGFGKQMLKYLTELALQRDCARFEWVVLDWNKNAIEFYKGIGAEVFPDWRVCRMDRSAMEQFTAV